MVLNCAKEDSWEPPWTARRSSQSILREINPECSPEGLLLKLGLQYFGYLMHRVNSSEKTLKLFCEICSAFNCSFDEFVGEKVVSPPYSFAILAPPPGEDSDTGEDWDQMEKAMTEEEMFAKHHWLNGHESEQILGDCEEQRRLPCCCPGGC